MPHHHRRATHTWFREDAWLPFALPLILFLVVGSLEPTADAPGGKAIGLAIGYAYYPWIYTVKLALTVAAILAALPALRRFPLRFSPLAVAVGLVGAVVWVGLASLRLESRVLSSIGLESFSVGTRSAFNPFEQIADPVWAWAFLAIRFFGLVLVIAVAEELFLRGFVMRLMIDEAWWTVPFGQVTRLSAIVGTAVPLLMHPQELLAAAVWFSLVTWLMTRTRSLWDCVLAHAVTNLAMGLYAVLNGHWELL